MQTTSVLYRTFVCGLGWILVLVIEPESTQVYSLKLSISADSEVLHYIYKMTQMECEKADRSSDLDTIWPRVYFARLAGDVLCVDR